LNRFSENLSGKNFSRKNTNDADLIQSKISTSNVNDKVKLTKQHPGLFGLIKKKKDKLAK